MLVKDIMTTDSVSVAPDEKVKDIALKLVEKNIKGVPVVEDKKVIGVITECDLILQNAKLHLPTFIQILDGVLPIGEKNTEEELRRIYGVCARDIMSRPAVTVDPEMPVDELATLMWEKKVNPVPVVKNGELIGIVSRADIIRLLLDQQDK